MEHFNRNDKLDFVMRSPGGKSAFKDVANLPMKELDVDIETTVSTKSYVNCQKAGYIKVTGKSKFGKDIKSVTWDFENICTLKYRVVRFLLSSGEYETIVTSLSRAEWSLEKIKELYNMRWGIETSFRELKYNIGMIHFHTKDEAFMKQEIFANLIAYNFCLAIAMTVKIRDYNSKKYEYRIDFSFAIHVIKDYLRDFSKSPPDKIDRIISKKLCPVRKGRADIRKMKPKNVIPFIYRVA